MEEAGLQPRITRTRRRRRRSGDHAASAYREGLLPSRPGLSMARDHGARDPLPSSRDTDRPRSLAELMLQALVEVLMAVHVMAGAFGFHEPRLRPNRMAADPVLWEHGGAAENRLLRYLVDAKQILDTYSASAAVQGR